MPQLAEKDAYSELTEKQQAVVDELVESPNAQNTEIAERAGVSRATVYNVLEKYDHIVESKMNQVGRHEGEETTEGDPFKTLDAELDSSPATQWISERPYQGETDDNAGNGDSEQQTIDDSAEDEHTVEVEAESEESEEWSDRSDAITLQLSKVDVIEILEGPGCEPIQDTLIRRIIDRAFRPQ